MSKTPMPVRWDAEYQRKTGLERDRFLAGGQMNRPPTAPSEIVESWQRSVRLGVDPRTIGTCVHEAGDEETELLRCVDAVLSAQQARLALEPVSIVFASPSGRILRRYCGDPSLSRVLERVSLSPGAGYGEGEVGTNGIGTTLENARPSLVVGDEHFNERLSVFACAGAPVVHPVSGITLGVVDLTCRAPDANWLLVGVAQGLAEGIQEELLRTVGRRELMLLCDYLAACRHATGPILAVGQEVVMMNRHAQQRLTPTDRSALLSRTADLSDEARATTFVADLPSGASARLDYRPSLLSDIVVGGVFRVHLDESANRPGAGGPPPRVTLPGVVGSSAPWRRACAQVRQDAGDFRWLVIQGEPGVGKTSLARAVHESLRPRSHFRMIDLAEVSDVELAIDDIESELAIGDGTLVLRHIERVPADMVGPLTELLVEHAQGSLVGGTQWVVATADLTVTRTDVDSAIVPCSRGPSRCRPCATAVRTSSPSLRPSCAEPLGGARSPTAPRRSVISRDCRCPATVASSPRSPERCCARRDRLSWTPATFRRTVTRRRDGP